MALNKKEREDFEDIMKWVITEYSKDNNLQVTEEDYYLLLSNLTDFYYYIIFNHYTSFYKKYDLILDVLFKITYEFHIKLKSPKKYYDFCVEIVKELYENDRETLNNEEKFFDYLYNKISEIINKKEK